MCGINKINCEHLSKGYVANATTVSVGLTNLRLCSNCTKTFKEVFGDEEE
jgi:hypothetical protein